MKMSAEGLVALIGHEAIVTSRYKDSVGVWTIGVGHTAAAGGIDPRTFTGTITVKQALDLLREDIVKYENGVNAAVKVALKQHEFDALVSFHYNTGKISSAQLTRTLNAGNKSQAGAEFMNWVKPPEIKGRRTAEMNLFLTGKYPPALVNVYPASASGAVQWSKGKRVDIHELLAVPAPTSPPTAPPVPIDAPPAPAQQHWLAALLSAIFGGSK